MNMTIDDWEAKAWMDLIKLQQFSVSSHSSNYIKSVT